MKPSYAPESLGDTAEGVLQAMSRQLACFWQDWEQGSKLCQKRSSVLIQRAHHKTGRSLPGQGRAQWGGSWQQGGTWLALPSCLSLLPGCSNPPLPAQVTSCQLFAPHCLLCNWTAD